VFERRASRSPGPDGEQRDKRELKGKKDDLDITVSMERQNRRLPRWRSPRGEPRHLDKDYAQQLLNKIVKQK